MNTTTDASASVIGWAVAMSTAGLDKGAPRVTVLQVRTPRTVGASAAEGDPDDHLKIFELAATIENWPQPVWCHMFNSTLVGNVRNWFSKLPRRSIDGFEELRRAFRLNFTQRKKCAKNPVGQDVVDWLHGRKDMAHGATMITDHHRHTMALLAIPLVIVVEAEYRGVANAVVETCWLRNLLRELHTPLATATLVYCDNVSAVYLSSNPVQHQRTKHIEIDIHFVRDLVATGAILVLHVPSRYQYADIFTKGLPTSLFDEFRTSLSIRSSPAPTAGGC
ncbi:ribonuclease H-like domain-containing protein [Tanacetum coccineum]